MRNLILFAFLAMVGGFFDYKGVEKIATGITGFSASQINPHQVALGLFYFQLGVIMFVISIGFLNQITHLKPSAQTIIWISTVIGASVLSTDGGFGALPALQKILFLLIAMSSIGLVITGKS